MELYSGAALPLLVPAGDACTEVCSTIRWPLSGLSGLLQSFQQSGHGHIINSWIGSGENQPIAPDQLHPALGPQAIDSLSRSTGVAAPDPISELLSVLPV